MRTPIPEAYLAYHTSGCTSSDPDIGVMCSRFRWLSPSDIDTWTFPIPRSIAVTPFAATPDRGVYGWCREQGECALDICPVIRSPNDSEFAVVVAADFAQFVAWALIEEARESWLADQFELSIEGLRAMLRANVRHAAPFMPAHCVDAIMRLYELSPSISSEGVSFIDATHAERIVSELIPFSRRGEVLQQY